MEKIGVFTIHGAYNYGAMLQAYATIRKLEQLGFDAEVYNFLSREYELARENRALPKSLKELFNFFYCRVDRKIKLRYSRFKSFHDEMKLSTRVFSLDDVYSNPPKYDVNIVGSDQVWNLQKGFKDKNFYFLDFLKPESLKMSYASSFGTSTIENRYNDKLKKLLTSFHALSVREDDGVEIIKNATGLDAQQVLDPTFLLSDSEWNAVAGEEDLIEEPYILYYGFSKDKKIEDIVNAFSKKLNLPVIAVSPGIHFPFKVKRVYKEAGPKEFINLVRQANLVLTGSFHGLAFAINYAKDFYLIEDSKRNSRMLSALRLFRLENRVVLSASEVANLKQEDMRIDYNITGVLLAEKRLESINWLNTAVLSLLNAKVAL